MRRRVKLFLIIALIFCVALGSYEIHKRATRDPPNKTLQIYKIAEPFLVYVECLREGQGKDTIGSGFIIREDGTLLTALHVVKDYKQIWAYTNAKEYPYEVVIGGKDERLDVALLVPKIPVPRGKIFAVLGDSDLLQTGESVWAVGSPVGIRNCITKGDLINKTAKPDAPWMKILLSGVIINEGNSGGPLLNEKGEVVGINVGMTGSQTEDDSHRRAIRKKRTTTFPVLNLTVTVPINYVKKLMPKLMSGHEISHIFMGMNLYNSWWFSETDLAQHGIKKPDVLGPLIIGIAPGSLALRNGLQVGDIIISINGKYFETATDVFEALFINYETGDELQFVVLRDGQYVVKIVK